MLNFCTAGVALSMRGGFGAFVSWGFWTEGVLPGICSGCGCDGTVWFAASPPTVEPGRLWYMAKPSTIPATANAASTTRPTKLFGFFDSALAAAALASTTVSGRVGASGLEG